MEPVFNEDEPCVLSGLISKCSVQFKSTAPLSKEQQAELDHFHCLRIERLLNSYQPPRLIGDGALGKQELFSANMNKITEDFYEKNLLGYTHFEKLYLGKFNDKVVVVKICNLKRNWVASGVDWILRIIDEIKFLETFKGHPNLVDVVGYCEEDKLMGVVYDLDPLCTLSNLISKGSLNWTLTIQIAVELAQLIAFLHREGYLVRNLAPDHILIDKEFKPRLVDLIMLTGGIMGDRTSNEGGRMHRPYSYRAPGSFFDKTSDVYVYGMILVNLIHKKVYDKNVPYCDQFHSDLWAKEAYNNRGVRSFVHESLRKEIDDSTEKKITKLAMDCFVFIGDKCLTMEQVVAPLLEIKSHVN